MIELKSVTKTYYSQNKPIEALKNINLNIEAGEIYGILGKSGAGKKCPCGWADRGKRGAAGRHL